MMTSSKFSRRHLLAGSAALCFSTAIGSPALAASEEAYKWATIPFGGAGFVSGFAFHPRSPNILYARTDIGGAYRYDFDNGRWLPLLDHLTRADGELMGVLSIGLDPQAPQKVYLACGEYLETWARMGAVLRSDDYGRSWQTTELPVRVGGNSEGRGTGERLQVDPWVGNRLLYASNREGLLLSDDGGASFAKCVSPADALSLVAFDPSTGSTGKPCARVYVGAFDNGGTLFVSNDGGASFQSVNGLPNQVPQHLVFDKSGDLYVTFAGGPSGLTVNPNGAMSGSVWRHSKIEDRWVDITPIHKNPSPGGYSGIDVGPDGRIVISSLDRWAAGDDLFVSTDKGASWIDMRSRADHDFSRYPWLVDYKKTGSSMGHWISDVRINPFNGNDLIYGTGYGVWRTSNLQNIDHGRVQFRFDVSDFEEMATLPFQLSVPQAGMPMAAFGDVAGGIWDDIREPPSKRLFHPSSETNISIDYAGLNPDIVVRTTLHTGTNGYYSSDFGLSWQPFAKSPLPRDEKGKVIGDPGVIAISANGKRLLWAPEHGAFWSKDGGASWHSSLGWPKSNGKKLIPVSDKARPLTFYMFDPQSRKMLISSDGGQKFKPFGKKPLTATGETDVQILPERNRPGSVWVALPDGLIHIDIFRSVLTRAADVNAAWLVGHGASKDARAEPVVFIWGRIKGVDGLWRSGDRGLTWVKVNDDAHQFGGLRAIAGDPKQFGTLYIAPHGRGLLVGTPQ